MINETNAAAFRQNLGKYLNLVQCRKDSVLIKQDGKPVAALIDANLFQYIRRMQERFDAVCAYCAAGSGQTQRLSQGREAKRCSRHAGTEVASRDIQQKRANLGISSRRSGNCGLALTAHLGLERDGVDPSAPRLTAYTIKNIGNARNGVSDGDPVKLQPTTDTGSGQMQDKARIALSELIARVNGLFEGDLTPGDKLVYVNNVIRGKLMESEKLIEQARNNGQAQFDNSPDLTPEITNAVMDASAAHEAMSKHVLASKELLAEIKSVLLGPGKLWEALRERGKGDWGAIRLT